jgi:hypothetical protein
VHDIPEALAFSTTDRPAAAYAAAEAIAAELDDDVDRHAATMEIAQLVKALNKAPRKR